MMQQSHLFKQRLKIFALWLAVLLLASWAGSAIAQDEVVLSVVEFAEFNTGDEIVVSIRVDNALRASGFDFDVHYPVSAFAGTPVTELGDWAGLLVSNAEQAGVVQIAYVYSDGTSESLENGLADESGVLVQLRFPVNCGGAPPTGIDALLSVTELKVHLAAEDGGLDLAPVLSVPGTVSFCKTVPNQEHSFGTLKARYQ